MSFYTQFNQLDKALVTFLNLFSPKALIKKERREYHILLDVMIKKKLLDSRMFFAAFSNSSSFGFIIFIEPASSAETK